MIQIAFLRLEHEGDEREEYMLWKILEKVQGKIILPHTPPTSYRVGGVETNTSFRKGKEHLYEYINPDEIGKTIENYDIVDTTEMNRWYGAEVCKKHDNVVISSMEDSPLFMTGYGYEDTFRKLEYYNIIKEKANHFIARSEATRTCMIQIGFNFEDISVIHQPINLERFKPKPKPIDLVPETKDKKVVLYIGRLEWGKGIFQLIDQFAKVAKDIPEAFLLMIGQAKQSPEIEEYLKERVKYHNIEDKVKMFGYVEGDIAPYYNLGDVFVSPQFRQEQYGWTFLEALASGLPIITNDVGTAREFISWNRNGYYLSSFNDMADYIKSVLSLGEFNEMGKKSRECAELNFNPETVAEEHVSLYKRLLECPHRKHVDLTYEQDIGEWMKKTYIPQYGKPYYFEPPDWYIRQQMKSENSLSTDVNHQHFSLEFMKEIPSNVKTVLDLGCSDGWSMERLREMGKEVMGVTISRKDYEVAKAKGLDVRVGDIHNIPLPNESVELVYARHVVEHSLRPKTVLYEIRRILKNEGYLFLVFPSMIWKGSDHYNLLPENEMIDLVKSMGFKIEKAYKRDIERIEIPLNMGVNYEIRLVGRKV